MMETNRIFVGDEQGIVRVLDIKSQDDFTSQQNHSTIQFGEANPEKAVECLSSFTAQNLSFLCIGRRDGALDICSPHDLRLLCQGSVNNPYSHCIRIEAWNQSINEDFPKIFSVWNTGQIRLHRFRKKFTRFLKGSENNEAASSNLKTVLNVKAADEISTSDLSREASTVAFGGDGVNLSICNLDSQELVFVSKPPRNPYGLCKRNWITACCFIPQTDGKILFNGTAERELCLYDIRASRHPVFTLEDWRESRVTHVLPQHDGSNVWVSNAMGFVDRFDLRQRSIRGSLKGQVAGSVRDLSFCQIDSNPFLASVGLDRMLRIYSTESRTLQLKHYCKYQLTSVEVIKMKVSSDEDDGEQGTGMLKKRKRNTVQEED